MTMHAVLGVWTTDESLRTQQEESLQTDVLPKVREHPGFVCGYWMRDPDTGKSHTTIVLDSEESAQSFHSVVAGNRQAQAQLGITNDTLAIVEVIAIADRLDQRSD